MPVDDEAEDGYAAFRGVLSDARGPFAEVRLNLHIIAGALDGDLDGRALHSWTCLRVHSMRGAEVLREGARLREQLIMDQLIVDQLAQRLVGVVAFFLARANEKAE